MRCRSRIRVEKNQPLIVADKKDFRERNEGGDLPNPRFMAWILLFLNGDMAKILGKAGRYVAVEAVRQRRKLLRLTLVAFGITGWISGFFAGSWLKAMESSPVAVSTVQLFWLLVMWAGIKWTFGKLDDLEKKAGDFDRGAEGEKSVGEVLKSFPDEFRIINDVACDNGNLDHVVVGPTGVFVLDTKNWRGVVSSDGAGELLLNGKLTNRPLVKQFIGRVMGIKDRVKALARGVDPYFQACFVFTAARVDANWGATGQVHCLRENQLFHYIVESKRGRKLSPGEIQRLAQAFASLARMETDFNEAAERPGLSQRPANFNTEAAPEASF